MLLFIFFLNELKQEAGLMQSYPKAPITGRT
jgi:hypothetical protein